MIEWGLTPRRYRGTFALLDSGRLTLGFDNYPYPWPTLQLDLDAIGLALNPPPNQAMLPFGNRGAAYIGEDQGSFWPLRLVKGKDETDILEMIETPKQ
jgi:hypothetical protein